jgi:hypothetical protein
VKIVISELTYFSYNVDPMSLNYTAPLFQIINIPQTKIIRTRVKQYCVIPIQSYESHDLAIGYIKLLLLTFILLFPKFSLRSQLKGTVTLLSGLSSPINLVVPLVEAVNIASTVSLRAVEGDDKGTR